MTLSQGEIRTPDLPLFFCAFFGLHWQINQILPPIFNSLTMSGLYVSNIAQDLLTNKQIYCFIPFIFTVDAINPVWYIDRRKQNLTKIYAKYNRNQTILCHPAGTWSGLSCRAARLLFHGGTPALRRHRQ